MVEQSNLELSNATEKFNEEAFQEYVMMANQVEELALKDWSLLKTPSRKPNTPQSFQGIPAVSGAKNWCGQAACASLIIAWGMHGGKSENDLMTEIYSRFPPDIFGGACGTSPSRIIEILNAYGLKGTYAQVIPWLAGGFLNPLNQFAWQNHRDHVENKWVMAGYPAIVLVDAGKINGPWFQPHWVPLAKVTDKEALICNSLGGQYSDLTMNIDHFHQAWEVYFLPNLNFVTVLVEPK